MDHLGILKRALKITWRQRALWIFGVLLALPASGSRGAQSLRYAFSGNDYGGGLPQMMDRLPFNQPNQWPGWHWPTLNPGAIVAIVIGAILVVLMLIAISLILHYLSTNALIKMVDQAETTGSAGTVGEGFRKGWSRPAWRMFLADLVIGVPFVIAATALILVGLAPLLLLTVEATGARALGIVLTVGIELIVILLIMLAGVLIGLLVTFTQRELALGNKGTLEAIGAAYALIRHSLKDVALVWVLMLGAGIGWGVVMIPVVLALLLLAGVIGGGPGFALYAATRSLPAALGLGLPLFLLVFLVPTLFLSGLYYTFVSSVWTLTYREIVAKETPPVEAPADVPMLSAEPAMPDAA
jgi:hypothetical protein